MQVFVNYSKKTKKWNVRELGDKKGKIIHRLTKLALLRAQFVNSGRLKGITGTLMRLPVNNTEGMLKVKPDPKRKNIFFRENREQPINKALVVALDKNKILVRQNHK